jgi:hypothetical protein
MRIFLFFLFFMATINATAETLISFVSDINHVTPKLSFAFYSIDLKTTTHFKPALRHEEQPIHSCLLNLKTPLKLLDTRVHFSSIHYRNLSETEELLQVKVMDSACQKQTGFIRWSDTRFIMDDETKKITTIETLREKRQRRRRLKKILHIKQRQTQRLQRELSIQGYDIGIDDGIAGEKTQKALIKFQKNNQIKLQNMTLIEKIEAVQTHHKKQYFPPQPILTK